MNSSDESEALQPADAGAAAKPEADLERELAKENLVAWRAYRSAIRARNGDTDAAKAVLKDLVGAVQQCNARTWNGAIHWSTARFLAEAFSKILAGEDAAISLGVKNSRPGRRRGTKTFHNHEVAAAFWLLRRRGFEPERANVSLQKEIGADRRTIQRAVAAKPHFQEPELFEEEDLLHFAGRYAAIIERILAAEK